ncbi:transcription factor TFIIF complex subunit Tfg3 [Coemansia brasiliensis]|uniref:Transcription factor TFIIF complex subunit Tfg3 n=1 Tax=Coemansia brasiliensis TaxID=2650707 RepID=A0A9W8IEF5_9FUNG|nr:transcription factor TFIIF complex subunit Tfg3 [Coemansia brasiliensis]
MVSEAEVMLAVQTQHHQTGRSVVANGVEYSLRRWSCALVEGRPRSSNAAQLPYVKKVEFILHETFKNPHRVIHHPPFKVEEEGWGEFDLVVIVHFINCQEPYRITHDLNFHVGEYYENKYPFIVPNPSAAFLALFNKHTTVSRKTIPARATKARKGPPRDSHYSTSQRASNSPLDSLSSHSSDYDSDSQLSSLDYDSDVPNPSSKPLLSASAASSGRIGAHLKRNPEKQLRSKRAGSRGIAGDNPMSSPLSAADEYRQRPASKAAVRQKKDSALLNVRRTTSDVSAPTRPRKLSAENALRGTGNLAGQKTVRPNAHSALQRNAAGATRSPPRGQPVQAQARMADQKAAAGRSSNSVSPPLSRMDRTAAAVGSTGIKRTAASDIQRKRAGDVLDIAAKNGARRRTQGPGRPASSPADSLPPDPATAVKRPPAIGIMGVKVPKKRTIKAAGDEGVATATKRSRVSGASAGRRGDDQLSPTSTSTSTTSSMSPPSRARALQQTSGAALSSREAFVRERERQRYMDPTLGSTSKGTARIQKAPGALGLLGKSARNGVAAVKMRAAAVAEDPDELAAADAPKRKTIKRDLSEFNIPKRNAGAAGMAAATFDAASVPAIDEKPRALAPRIKRATSADKPVAPSGLALSPEALRKMERIAERASQLNERAMVGFLRLLHSLRVEQEPESAALITEEAVDQVETSGMYSCNLTMLAPEAIDRLWAFVREVRV